MNAQEVRERLEIRYHYDENIYYVVEKSKLKEAAADFMAPIPVGFPIPSSCVKDWPRYILKYDPFGWWTPRPAPSVYAAKKNAQRQREKRIAKARAQAEEQSCQ